MKKHTIGWLAAMAIAGAGPAPAAAAQGIDDDEIRRAEAFARLVEANQPAPRGPVAQTGAFIDAGRGPIPVQVPASYDPETPAPLVILLHGYTSSGPAVEAWMQLGALVDEFGFLYLYPTGTSDFVGPFWNATDACCNFYGSGVDDSGYLRAVIEAMRDQYNVDDRRIHFVGHSNGGFMSYRMACDHADVVASIASLAGATFLNPNDCTPSAPVHTLQIHGTSDGVISYGGGCIPLFGGCYPGAVQTAETWATYDGCSTVGTTQPETLDIDSSIPGAETQVTRFATDCDPGGSAELWTIPGGPHSPDLSADYNRLVVEYLFAHPKPSLCPADLDGGGAVGFEDLLALLAAWGACPACPQDLDGDGDVDFQDLLIMLAAWGPCA